MAINSLYKAGGSMSTYGSKGMSGLMSGMDIDELVTGMTMGTTSKIAKQQQSKQLLQWKSDSYRAISTQLIDFSKKFMSFTSTATNLFSSNFFSKSLITASGENSKYVSVSGKSNSADTLQILSVKKMASDANQNLTGGATGKVETDVFDLDGTSSINNIQGQTLSVKYGGTDYQITMVDKIALDPSDPTNLTDLDYSTWDKALESINTIIKNDDSLADLKGKVEFKESATAGKLQFGLVNENDSNTFEIRGGTKKILQSLGLSVGDKATASNKTFISSKSMEELKTTVTVSDKLDKKSMTFTYNGVTKSITLPGASELEDMDGKAFAKHIQEQIDDAFGKGRVAVKFEQKGSDTKGSLSFETTLPDGTKDGSSVFKIASADTGLLGSTGIFGISQGSSNRVNTNVSVEKSGLKGASDPATGASLMKTVTLKDEKGESYEGYAVSINGKAMTFKATDSISEIMSKINNAKVGVQISYNETADTFSLRATDGGASGRIEFQDLVVDENGEIVKDSNGDFVTTPDAGQNQAQGNLADILFAASADAANPSSTYTSTTKQAGQDAQIEVDFDGHGVGAGPTIITRSSNTFNLDGLNITVTQEFDSFKRDKDGDLVDSTGAKLADQTDITKAVIDTDNVVKFSAKADADKIVEAVKQMAEDYNTMVDAINTARTEKRDRDYAPLTAAQKEEMSEKEIEAWEEKAKAGMLFNDTALNSLANDLRFVFSSYTANDIASVGITNSGTTGSAYSNNGKITIDEEKLRTALSERPDDVAKLFTTPLTTKTVTNSDGTTREEVDITTGGVMSRLKAITDKYASVTGAVKGILVEKAGHSAAPTSLFSNSIKKQMDDIDKTITKLQSTLSSEESRYYRQFTQLEQLVAQMNSQSSWFSQMSGGQ